MKSFDIYQKDKQMFEKEFYKKKGYYSGRSSFLKIKKESR